MIGKRIALLLLGPLLSAVITDGARVKRIKSGKVYAQHEAVHIVVNKVG